MTKYKFEEMLDEMIDFGWIIFNKIELYVKWEFLLLLVHLIEKENYLEILSQ